ncbi:hypothetical protein [Nonomuraea sediminis]|uniref:hypothetical protein n=1 Tax=Nonomuraea sediminis TaxID=2835864 RepID=UPI001BDC69D3|nr:hypothetical protein [Nonomuraea sediminis]
MSDTFERPQTPPEFWVKPSRTRRVVHLLRQGKYGRRTIKFVARSTTAPAAGTARLATTAWRWIRADDYAGTDDHIFRESVRTRRRRQAWMLGLAYLGSTAAGTAWWSTTTPLVALAAVAGLGTVVEVHKRIAARPIPFKIPGRKGGTPQESVVVRAAIDAKLGRAEGMRLAAPVLTEDGGWSTILQLPPGQRARSALGREADFASALGAGESQVVFELIDEHAGRLAIFVVVLLVGLVVMAQVFAKLAASLPQSTPSPRAQPSVASRTPSEAQERVYLAKLKAIDPGLVVNTERAIRRAENICGRILDGADGGKLTLEQYVVQELSGGNATIDQAQARQVIKAVKVWCR